MKMANSLCLSFTTEIVCVHRIRNWKKYESYLHVKEVFISIIICLSQKWNKDYSREMKAKINFIFPLTSLALYSS